MKISKVITLTVDYNKSLEEMIALGKYRGVESCITSEYYPVKGSGVVKFEAVIFRFPMGLLTHEKEDMIRRNGWKPAKIEHLLAFGKSHRSIWRRPYQWVIAVGSWQRWFRGSGWFDGEGASPGLRNEPTCIELEVHAKDSPDSRFGFLAVRRKKEAQ